MPVFEYAAVDSAGKQRKGSLDADNVRVARQRLRNQGLFPTDIKESSELSQTKSRDVRRYFQRETVSAKDLAICTRQLATLVSAGLPLVSALQSLAEQTDTVVFRRIIVSIREKVEEGSSLAQAMGSYRRVFPALYVNLVAAGEASGALDAVLENLADYLEAQLELRRKIFSATLYPVLMLVICVVVLMVLFTFVVPKVVDIFKKQGAVLPLPTQIMIQISDFLTYYWWLALAVAFGLVALVRWYYQQAAGRERIDRLLLRLPLYGSLYVKINTARVSQTLGTLLSSGVGLLTGLEITRNIISNVHLARAIDDAKDGVREGRSLAKEFSRSGFFPPMLSQMVAVGETSGELEKMLKKAGQSYQKEVDATLAGLTTLLEPLMMVFVGAIVFSVVISVLMPMADLVNIIQQ